MGVLNSIHELCPVVSDYLVVWSQKFLDSTHVGFCDCGRTFVRFCDDREGGRSGDGEHIISSLLWKHDANVLSKIPASETDV